MQISRGENLDRVLEALSQEFRADAVDTLDRLAARLDIVAAGDASEAEDLLRMLLRDAHTLKGQGGSFNFPSITLIAHRLEDYLCRLSALESRHVVDVRRFIDTMAGILESGVDPGDAECSRLLRELPAKGAALSDYRSVRDMEVLLVATSSVVARAVDAKLHAHGVRVVWLRKPLAAFETAIRSRPDMVIAAALMEGVNGIDLARAFAAMSATRNIPFVLLTSFDRNHPELRGLPSSTGFIRHDLDLDGQIDEAIRAFDAG